MARVFYDYVKYCDNREELEKRVKKTDGTSMEPEFLAYAAIVKNPLAEVKIVDSLDFICGSCLSRNDRCISTHYAKTDKNFTDLFGLEIGKIYSSGELIGRLNRLHLDWGDFISCYAGKRKLQPLGCR